MEKQNKKRWFSNIALDGVFWLAMGNIGWLLAEFLLFGTARLLVRLFSFGRLAVEDFYDNQSGFNWFGLKRGANGRLWMSADMAKIIAVCFWFLCVAVVGVTLEGLERKEGRRHLTCLLQGSSLDVLCTVVVGFSCTF